MELSDIVFGVIVIGLAINEYMQGKITDRLMNEISTLGYQLQAMQKKQAVMDQELERLQQHARTPNEREAWRLSAGYPNL